MKRALPILTALACALLFAGCLSVTTRTNPARISNGGTSKITTKITDDGRPLVGRTVLLELVDGEECGELQETNVTTDERGIATAVFVGDGTVENCTAVVRVSAEGRAREALITVNPTASAGPRIDGVSAIAVILIASFAIDRIVTGLLFLMSFAAPWARRFPDPRAVDDPAQRVRAEKRQKLVYFCLAALLGMLVLGWYGRVRILTALGFSAVDPLLDTVITGLILVGGADRTSELLKRFGTSSGGAPSSSSAPIEVTGRLVLEGSSGERGMEGSVRPSDSGE